MIRKSGYRFSERSCSNGNIKRDGDSKKRHPALDPLDDDRGRHAARGAHRHQAALEVAPLQLIKDRADQDRTGRADPMAQRDRAAVDVDLVAIELEVPDELFGDHPKRLVDLAPI